MSSNHKHSRDLQSHPKPPPKRPSGPSSSSNPPKPKQPVPTHVTINVLPGATLNVFVAGPTQAVHNVKGAGKTGDAKKPYGSGSGQAKKPIQQGTGAMKTLLPVAGKKGDVKKIPSGSGQVKKPIQQGTGAMKTLLPVAGNKKK